MEGVPPPTANGMRNCQLESCWMEARRCALIPPSARLPDPGQRSNLQQKRRLTRTPPLLGGTPPLPHPLESPGSCNFNKRQHRAHALPHHSLADFLAAIVQSLLHFPPSVGRAPFAHSSLLKSQSSDPSEPAGASTSSSKSLHQKEGPLVHRAGSRDPTSSIF